MNVVMKSGSSGMPPPIPPRPNARSTVPGSRISARVAVRASERGSSAVPRSDSGTTAFEVLQRQAALLRGQPFERLPVRLLEAVRRRRPHEVPVALDSPFVIRLGAPSRGRGPRRRSGVFTAEKPIEEAHGGSMPGGVAEDRSTSGRLGNRPLAGCRRQAR